MQENLPIFPILNAYLDDEKLLIGTTTRICDHAVVKDLFCLMKRNIRHVVVVFEATLEIRNADDVDQGWYLSDCT
jgi:hypothetical protein